MDTHQSPKEDPETEEQQGTRSPSEISEEFYNPLPSTLPYDSEYNYRLRTRSLIPNQSCSDVELVLALQAFKPKTEWIQVVPANCVKELQTTKNPAIPTDQDPNTAVEQLPVHCAIQTIEKLEMILKHGLYFGLNMATGTKPNFGKQEVPRPLRSLLRTMKIVLEPIKNQIKTKNDVYYRGLMNAIDNAIQPLYNYLVDSQIILESPALKPITQEMGETYEQATIQEEGIEQIYKSAEYPTFNLYTSKFGTETLVPNVHPWGLIEFPLRNGIDIILTLDFGVCIFHQREKLIICLSADGARSGMRYRWGDVYQNNESIEITCTDLKNKILKRAKMRPQGVYFQDESRSSGYFLQPGGAKTCRKFRTKRMSQLLISEVFYSGSRVGDEYLEQCQYVLNKARLNYSDGSIKWYIGNLYIKQDSDGSVILHRNHCNYTIVVDPTGPKEGCVFYTARLTTPQIHLSCDTSPSISKYYLYVKQYINKICNKVFTNDGSFKVHHNSDFAGIRNNEIYLRNN